MSAIGMTHAHYEDNDTISNYFARSKLHHGNMCSSGMKNYHSPERLKQNEGAISLNTPRSVGNNNKIISHTQGR